MDDNEMLDNDEMDYNPELDNTIKRLGNMKVNVLTLKDVNRLRVNRDIKRKELMDDAAFDAALYADPIEQEGGGGMGF